MKEDRWISVNDKLPQTETRVMAVCKTPLNGWQVAECHFIGNDFLYDFLLYGQISVHATYWMELPKFQRSSTE